MKRVLIAIAFVLLTASPVRAGIVYSVTDLGELPGGRHWSVARAINNVGQIVGRDSVDEGTHGFLYSGGVMTDLGVLQVNHNYSTAVDINDSGQIVGTSETTGVSLSKRPFLLTDGVMTPLGSFGGDYGWAGGINNAGEVVGLSRYANGRTHAFLFSGGNMIDLFGSGATCYSDAYSINDHRQVVGDYATTPGAAHGYLWENGSITDLGDLEDGSGVSHAYHINNSRQIVGESTISGSPMGHAFLWENGLMRDLGVLPGENSSYALGINDSGVVVGKSYGGTGERAFVWDSVDGIQDLNTLLDSSGTGWSLRAARDINEAGHIVGWGINPDGLLHAYQLTPVPEPSTLCIWSLLSAVVGFGAWSRRRLR